MKSKLLFLAIILWVPLSAQNLSPGKSLSLKVTNVSMLQNEFEANSEVMIGYGSYRNDQDVFQFSTELIARIYQPNRALRFTVGYSMLNMNLKLLFSDEYSDDVITDEIKTRTVSASAGLERHFRVESISFYAGLSVPLMYLAPFREVTEISSTYKPTNSSNRDEFTYKVPGGFGFGVQSMAGFNYYFGRNFSIGTEFSTGFLYVKSGGKIEIEHREDGVTKSYKSDKSRQSGLANYPFSAAVVFNYGF